MTRAYASRDTRPLEQAEYMAIQYDDSSRPPAPASAPETTGAQTVVGIFEDTLDVRQALSAIRKDGCPANGVSIVIRDRRSDEGGAADRHGAVARLLAATDLNGHASWLVGLASLVVPQRGTFLVAGPIGVAVAGVSGAMVAEGESAASALAFALTAFGFSDDDALYLDHRLTAGGLLAGITSTDPQQAENCRTRLADANAVYLGAARTDSEVVEGTRDLLVSPPEIFAEGDVVVTDAVANLTSLREGNRSSTPLSALIGSRVIDTQDEDAGTIEDIIADGSDDVGHATPRYVVVVYGGMLGIGKKRAVVPAAHVDLDGSPPRLRVDRDTLQRAPSYDNDAPFSRREEHLICAYFGVQPYWNE